MHHTVAWWNDDKTSERRLQKWKVWLGRGNGGQRCGGGDWIGRREGACALEWTGAPGRGRKEDEKKRERGNEKRRELFTVAVAALCCCLPGGRFEDLWWFFLSGFKVHVTFACMCVCNACWRVCVHRWKDCVNGLWHHPYPFSLVLPHPHAHLPLPQPHPPHQSDKWHASHRVIIQHMSSVWQPCTAPILLTLHHLRDLVCLLLPSDAAPLKATQRDARESVERGGKQWKLGQRDAFYLSIFIILRQCGSTLGEPVCEGSAQLCVFACMHEYALNKDSMQWKHDCLCAAWEEVVSVFLCPSVSTVWFFLLMWVWKAECG